MTININTKTAIVSAAVLSDRDDSYRSAAFKYGLADPRTVRANNALASARDAFTADKSASALRSVLDDVQHSCTARTVSASDVLTALDRIQRKLSITKKALEGTTVHVDLHAQTFPGAYHGIPESTQFRAVFHSGSWRVTDISRDRCTTRQYTVALSDSAKLAVLDNASRLAL